MGTTVYQSEFFGDTYRIRGNFADASCPVETDDAAGNWWQTGMQVADFRHSSEAAMRHILESAVRASGDDVDEFAEAVQEAIDDMQ